MSTLVVTLIAAGTLAFGAVYPWAYLPLLSAAALIGTSGLRRGGVRPHVRPLALALVVVWLAMAIQVLPLPRAIVDAASPATAPLALRYNLALSGTLTEWLPLSIDPRSTGLALVTFGMLGLYLVGLPSLLTGASLRSLPTALASFAVPLAAFVIYTREYQNGLIYGFWQPLDGGGGDQAGPFVNRNHFGGWILLALCLMLGWLFGQMERALGRSGRRRPLMRALSEDPGALLPMGTAILLGAMSLFWIISRSAITSFALAAGLFAWLVLTRRRLHSRQRIFGLTSLAVVLVAAVAWRGLGLLVRWFLDERSLVSRLDAWRDGWAVIQNFPVFGTGMNTYSTAMLAYQQRNPDFHMAQAHNDYLQLLAEGGLLVAVPALVAALLLARAVGRVVRASRSEARGYWIRAGAAIGLAAIAVQEIVEFSLQVPVNALLFCTLAAVALTPPTAARSAPSRDTIDASQGSSSAALS